jgi:hypothetical protein
MPDDKPLDSRDTTDVRPRSVTVRPKAKVRPARKREDRPRRPLPSGEYRPITDRGEPTAPREPDHDPGKKY